MTPLDDPTHPVEEPRGGAVDWIRALDGEDLAFIKRFVLASGSLKATAEAYGVSYPTVRLRLDRLIRKLELLDQHPGTSAFERRLRLAHAEDRVDGETFRTLLAAYRKDLEGRS